MNNKSFTIVEIMVVMAVIGIIMTLSIVGIQAAQKQQRVTVITNDVNQFKLMLASYYSEYRRYPSEVDTMYYDSATQTIWLCAPSKTVTCDLTTPVATLKLSQPGVHWYRAGLLGEVTPCTEQEQPNVGGMPVGSESLIIPSAEKWVLNYHYQDVSRPQVYKIK